MILQKSTTKSLVRAKRKMGIVNVSISLLMSLMVLLGNLGYAVSDAHADSQEIVRYEFEDNANDSSGNGNHGTIHGAVSFADGYSGKAAVFDGTSGYIELPQSLIKDHSPLTISTRFKTTQYGAIIGYQNIPPLSIDNGTQWMPILYIDTNGKMQAKLWTNSGSKTIASTNIVNDGVWHQVTLNIGSSLMRLSIDGELMGQISASVNHLAMNYNQIGVVACSGYSGCNQDKWFFYNGMLDDFYLIAEDTANNSTISPTGASFDRNTENTDAGHYQDVVVSLELNGNTLTGINNGNTTLIPGIDYTVSGSVVTIKKEYLEALGTGTHVLTFDMSAGTDPTLTVTVSDTTAAPAVTNVAVSPSIASIIQGGSQQLTATVSVVGGAAQTVTWTSSDESAKVTVDTTGNVTAAADAVPGNYTITATSTADPSKTGTATITVIAAPTYTIAAISDQTAAALIQGYASGAQETKTISVTNTGTGHLTNLTAALSGTNASDFDITEPLAATLNSGESTSFTVKAKDGLAAGTYTATVIVSADNMTDVTFTVTQAVNLPNAPANPQDLAAARGDRQVALNWSPVTGAAYYNLYMSTASGEFSNTPVATVTDPTCNVQNLINGTTYYFIVKAGNAGGLSSESNQASATPATVPTAPTNVAATAGNGKATITFTAPTDNGGSAVTGYEVSASSENTVITGTASPITFTDLTNGKSYTFTVKAINEVGSSASSAESNAVVPRSPSSNDNSDSLPTTPASPEPANSDVDVLVNGKVESAGTAVTTTVNDQTVTTIAVDQKKLEDKLAAEGQGAVVTIPVNTKSDVVVGELNGEMVKNMEEKQAVLEIKTDRATYTLPAQQINIDSLSIQMGKPVDLHDIKVQIEIAASSAATVRTVENAAAKGSFVLVAQPIDFTVRAAHEGASVEVSTFNAYVERTIAIPDGVDPNKITTGVVVDPDGTVRHVPTKVIVVDGKYYAKVNSLTNSTYSIVWHPLEFTDVSNHWAKDAVNDMGSRMIINGNGDDAFSPDRDITRAEFASIIVRGLGLKLEHGAAPFQDVKESEWYSSAITTAYAYHLINGFEDGTFRPNDKITREQAMVIIAKAMTITNLKAKLPIQSTDGILGPYADAEEASAWAQSSMADNVRIGIVSGRSDTELAPKDYMTRAEVAEIVKRLLQISNLI